MSTSGGRRLVIPRRHRRRTRKVTLQGTIFRLRTLAAEKHFGLTHAWRDSHRVPISDPTRTVIDVLSDPTLGGGIRHVAEILDQYVASEHRNDSLLIEYGERLGNRTVFKRLGYLLEERGADEPTLVAASLARRSSGITRLDPSIRSNDRIVSPWNLEINAELQGSLVITHSDLRARSRVGPEGGDED